MQAKPGLLDTNKGRRFGVAENCQKAKVAERAVRQSRRRHRKITLAKENLNRSSFHNRLKIADALVQILQPVQDRRFDFGRLAQAAEEKAKIGKILFETITAHIGLLRFPEHRVP